jgi:hypothetical protein
MVDLLMMFHLHENFRGDCPVCPPDVPFCVILICFDLPFEFFADLGDDFVLTVCFAWEKYPRCS